MENLEAVYSHKNKAIYTDKGCKYGLPRVKDQWKFNGARYLVSHVVWDIDCLQIFIILESV